MTHTSPHEAALGDSNKTQPESGPLWKSPLALAIAALATALIAVVVALAAWIHPGTSHYSDQESAQAKTNVCTAFWPVHQAVWKGFPNPHPGDPVAQLSVAANVRLALIGGGSYLRETLASEPATPADLTKAVSSFANTLQRLGVNYLAKMGDKALMDSLHHDLDQQGPQVAGLCKKK